MGTQPLTFAITFTNNISEKQF